VIPYLLAGLLGCLLLISIGDIARASPGGTFPDNLSDQYSAQDFRLRSAQISGDVRFLERHYSGLRGLDGQAALMELYRRADMTNDLRRTAQAYRNLLRQQPAAAWRGSRLWLALARSHEYLGEWEEASRNYRRSLEHQVSASTWERIMEMEIALGRADASEAACREWLRVRSAGERLRQRELARLYERLGARNAAAQMYARAAENMPLDFALLAGYLRCEANEQRRVEFAARVLARDGHNLNHVQSTVETLIAQGRAHEARQVLELLSPFFSARRSPFWALLIARASAAAADWERAASSFRQARLWRPNAPAEEQSYYLLHEADAHARLGREDEMEALLAMLPGLFWNEGAVFARLRLLCATNASGYLMESLLIPYASQPGGRFENQTTNFMIRLSDFVFTYSRAGMDVKVYTNADADADANAEAGTEAEANADADADVNGDAEANGDAGAEADAETIPDTDEHVRPVSLISIVEGLWLSHLQRKTDAITAYEAGRFFLYTGQTERAYGLFANARSEMRAFGGLLPYLVIAAERLGHTREAEEYRAQGCYLLGRSVYLARRSEILARSERMADIDSSRK
jgi:predicted  nucleic acid-binding Zn-ribbon protein